MEWTEMEERAERALLVSLDTGEFDAQASLDELYELVKSAGAEPVSSVMQKRPAPDTAFCVGSGMLEEIAQACRIQEIDLLVFDRELTPTQIRNIEDKTEVRVVDRTMLILDIFAQRARSSEGKLQVELAQLKYMLPRLAGKGTQLSRLGGGVGTRGPGETKLESDRRHIRRRITALREQLEQVEKRREQVRRRREKDGVITVALVGYTNAGKSTLMNQLTQAGVLAEDKLFATLDPTARALKLPGGKTVMLIETVVLLSKLNTKQHIDVELNLDELDLTAAESKATYDEIKAYVQEKYGLKVSSLYISQIKRKCGLDVGPNYNLPKKDDAKVPRCPPEKEAAIVEALKYFQMI